MGPIYLDCFGNAFTQLFRLKVEDPSSLTWIYFVCIIHRFNPKLLLLSILFPLSKWDKVASLSTIIIDWFTGNLCSCLLPFYYCYMVGSTLNHCPFIILFWLILFHLFYIAHGSTFYVFLCNICDSLCV